MARPRNALTGDFLVVGIDGAEETVKAFGQMNSRVRDRVRETVERASERVKERARTVELVSMVDTRTGRLARGLVTSRRETPTSIGELTFHRNRHFYFLSAGSQKHEVTRKAHTRRVDSRSGTGLVGWKTLKTRTRLKWGKTQTGIAFVKNHPMKVNLKPHPFMASAFRAVGGANVVRREVEAAVALGLQEAQAGITAISHDYEG